MVFNLAAEACCKLFQIVAVLPCQTSEELAGGVRVAGEPAADSDDGEGDKKAGGEIDAQPVKLNEMIAMMIMKIKR
jgi:hypothetical protein